jgi:voltage-gated potassium channel
VLVTEVDSGAPEANITSLPDGLWWAISMVTTVGDGDAFPTTAVG